MYFWLKALHITAMAVWFAGLFFLPRLFIAQVNGNGSDRPDLDALGKTLFFGIMTPGAAVTVSLGIVLLAHGIDGVWLPAKLGLVAAMVLLHVYYGQLLLDLGAGRTRHGVAFYRFLNWVPIVFLLGIAALVAAKPRALPPLGGL